MNSWENLILQWINYLQSDANDCIKDIEDLQDGTIYYKLIGRTQPWNCEQYNNNHREVVLQYLKDEYPNFSYNNKNRRIANLSIASLILCRLSLDPTFHKALCTNLPSEMQIKIKSILESFYPLGKNVTAKDIYRIFSLSDEKTLCTKPKFLLEEFLNSPVVKSVNNDNKIYEQAKQIRRLRADIETMHYEKSELIEDIKSQGKKIQELQQKLQESLLEIKLLRKTNASNNSINYSSEVEDVKSIETFYKKELENLESFVTELQNSNFEYEKQKEQLESDLKLCRGKCRAIEEQNKSNEELLESMLIQMEKKEEELTELKLKHEELSNYMMEKSKMYLINQSYETDDRVISETSLIFNKSEPLSSIIEIQLQDTKKELAIMQNKYNNLNSLLTMMMEEFDKLKLKHDKCMSIEKPQTYNKTIQTEEIKELKRDNNIENLGITAKYSNSIRNEMKLSFSKEFAENLKKLLFKDLKSQNIVLNSLHSNSSLSLKQEIPKDSNELTIQKYKNNQSVHHDINNLIICNYDKEFDQEKWYQQLPELLQILIKKFASELKTAVNEDKKLNDALIQVAKNDCITSNKEANLQLLNFVKTNFKIEIKCVQTEKASSILHIQDSSMINNSINNYNNLSLTHKQTSAINTIFDTILRNGVQKHLKSLQLDNIPTKVSLLTKNKLKSLHSHWNYLHKFIQNDFKIIKVVVLLEKSWLIALDSLKDIINNNFSMQPELKELFQEKDAVENELKNINLKNLQILSIHLMNAVQFVSNLNNECLNNTDSVYHESKISESLNDLLMTTPSESTFNNKLEINEKDNIIKSVVNLKKRIDNFNYSIEMYNKKCTTDCTPVDNYENKENENINVCKKEAIKLQNRISEFKEPEPLANKQPNNNANNPEQFQEYAKEIHEKYEFKLEKMKEKMKSAFNSQITKLKKDHEIATTSKLKALQEKLEHQCFNHTEELKKYKNHISELTTQLWDVGEKLIIEKQKKESFMQKLKDLKTKSDSLETYNPQLANNHELDNHSFVRPEIDSNAQQMFEAACASKMQSLKGFQLMGNAFSTEDEEGEVFDTTYLTDVQKSRSSMSTADINRLSILQMRNAKCKPHLKSSYPAEMQFYPTPLTEDEIKTGTAEEVFNDSLSQSLLTGKKVKRGTRTTRNTTGTPQRTRRFSNIFRRGRLSTDRK